MDIWLKVRSLYIQNYIQKRRKSAIWRICRRNSNLGFYASLTIFSILFSQNIFKRNCWKLKVKLGFLEFFLNDPQWKYFHIRVILEMFFSETIKLFFLIVIIKKNIIQMLFRASVLIKFGCLLVLLVDPFLKLPNFMLDNQINYLPHM